MARPQSYDDTQLPEIIADLPVSDEAKTNAEAQRKAAAYMPGWDNWQEHTRTQLFDRPGKKYAAIRTKLEQGGRERIDQRKHMIWLPKFLPPTVLTSPLDPSRQRQSAEMLDLEAGLRDVSMWAGELADLLKRQWLHGEVNRDLVAHAREQVNLVQKEQTKFERKNPPS